MYLFLILFTINLYAHIDVFKKCVSSDNLEQNIVDKFAKLSKIGFLWNVLQLLFHNFKTQLSKSVF